jgi:hypothetical protein
MPRVPIRGVGRPGSTRQTSEPHTKSPARGVRPDAGPTGESEGADPLAKIRTKKPAILFHGAWRPIQVGTIGEGGPLSKRPTALVF